MSENEYDVIDELYFVSSFEQLASTLSMTHDELFQSLEELLRLGYVKSFYPDPDTEIEYNAANFAEQHEQYFYLATKLGLMAHNSR